MEVTNFKGHCVKVIENCIKRTVPWIFYIQVLQYAQNIFSKTAKFNVKNFSIFLETVVYITFWTQCFFPYDDNMTIPNLFFFGNYNNLFWTIPKSIIVDLYWMYVIRCVISVVNNKLTKQLHILLKQPNNYIFSVVGNLFLVLILWFFSLEQVKKSRDLDVSIYVLCSMFV